MKLYGTWCSRALAMVVLLFFTGISTRAQAQEKQHVVSLDELKKDAARPAATRQANEAAVRELLSSEQGQQALKSAKFDFQRVDKAIGQMSDEDVATLAERSRPARADFAAGRISDRDLLWIILIIVGIIILALALR